MLRNFTNCIMHNKNILIITPFFAPETHAAVFRAHKLVKYLKREGWNPIVITVDTNYNYNEDVTLLKDLEGVEIHRTKYVEPSLRGLYMWLTGKDRTFKTLKAQGFFKDNDSNNSINYKSKLSIRQSAYNFFLENWLNVPDRFWTWKKSAIKRANKLIKEKNIHFVYTTMPPFTTGNIGLEIKKQNPNVKWIADFRDPLTTVLRNHSGIDHVYFKQRKIKHNVVAKSDVVITASLAHKNILHDIFKGEYFEKIHFIPTGLDNDFQVSNSYKEEDTILYAGEYLIENGFYIFDLITQYNSKSSFKIRLKIIGNKEINYKIIKENVDDVKLLANVDFLDHLPQKELYKEIVKAKACLLISEGRWWCSFAKMVDYIALRKTVIALVPEISEAKTQLTKANLGVFLTSDLDQDLEILTNFFKNSETKPNIEFCSNYLAISQANSFIKIISKL